MFGMIIRLYITCNGSTHDRQLYFECDVARNPHDYFEVEELILGDSEF